MEELSISWNELIHPDMEAIRRRDEFLNSNMCENIKFIDGEIHADTNMNLLNLRSGFNSQFPCYVEVII